MKGFQPLWFGQTLKYLITEKETAAADSVKIDDENAELLEEQDRLRRAGDAFIERQSLPNYGQPGYDNDNN
jgi:hypothetical protein